MQNSPNSNVEFDDKEFGKKIPVVDLKAESPLERVFVEKAKLPVKVFRRILILIAIVCFVTAAVYFLHGLFLINERRVEIQ